MTLIQGAQGHPTSFRYGLSTIKEKEYPYGRVVSQSLTYDLE